MPPPSPKETVAMTFPAEGVALNFFWREVFGATVLLTIFLSAVQSDAVMFHLQWGSVTKSLHHQPYNRRANLSTLLSAWFCDSRSRFVEPIEHTVLNMQRCQCCSHFLVYRELIFSLSGCNLSVVSNEFISTFKKRLNSACCCWPPRARRVNEFRLAFRRNCSSWSPTGCAFNNGIDTLYIFKPLGNEHYWYLRHEKFSYSSVFKTHITIQPHWSFQDRTVRSLKLQATYN